MGERHKLTIGLPICEFWGRPASFGRWWAKAAEVALKKQVRRMVLPCTRLAGLACKGMPRAGHVYILTNPSMPGLVKIGKTRRTSDARAEELSGVTGVPAEFIVAFEIPVSDCDVAELEVHRELVNFRFQKKREFFKIELRHAIRVVMEIASRFAADSDTPNHEQPATQESPNDGLTPLHRACLNNDAEKISALMSRGADPNSKTEDGVTPLMIAAGRGHSKAIDLLLQAGANIDATAADGSTATSLATKRGHVYALNVLNYYRRRLGESGLGESGPAGTTQLMLACLRNDIQLAESLLKEGADVDLTNDTGDTALDFAAKRGATKIAELLLKQGASSIKAARVAEEAGHFVLAQILAQAINRTKEGFHSD
jgi:hypothetical protein